MNPDRLALARRLVACPRFVWLPGMRIASPPELAGLRVAPGSVVSPAALPDLDDPATVGCLLALVRAVRADPCIHATPCVVKYADGTSPLWFVYTGAGTGPIGTGPTEAAALVAALLAADATLTPPQDPR